MNKIWRNKTWLTEQYVNQKKSMKTISLELGLGETCVHKWLHRFNIPIRSRSIAMKGLKKSDEHKRKLSEWAKQRLGEENPNWRGGVTKQGVIIRGRGWRERKRIVFERDNYECQECGIDFDLCIHHIKSIKDFPELVNDFSNCVTLCGKCHRNIHFGEKNSANSVNPKMGNAELNLLYPLDCNGIGNSNKCVETIHGIVGNN